MFNQTDLRPFKGAKKQRRIVGRGESSGHGKTCGRGMNGQNCRSGGGTRPGFEGGQMPIYKRLPKLRGFTNLFKTEFAIINVSDLNQWSNEKLINIEFLKEKNLVKKSILQLKVLGLGDCKTKVNIEAHKFSKSAGLKIVEAGGTFKQISLGQ